MEIVKEDQLAEFINQDVSGYDKVRREIDAILPWLNMQKSTLCEIGMISNCLEKINQAEPNFFWQLSHHQADVEYVLQDMLRNHEIDNELKQDILKPISDLQLGDGLQWEHGLFL